MAQTYTLDDAARHLNLSVDEFKRRLREDWKHVRSFRDGPTLRFRSADIDELARTIGLGSSDELPLAEPVDSPSGVLVDDSNIMQTPPKPIKVAGPKPLGDNSNLESDAVILLDPGARTSSKPGSDSDVRLEKATKPKKKSVEDDESILTDEFELPSEGGSGKLTGKSGKLSSAQMKAGDSGKMKAVKPPTPTEEDSSEFELSLDPDSDEFELSLTDDSSEEVSFNLPAHSGPKGEQSGINLNKPKDSGVSLEQSGRMKKPTDEEIDFELSLDSPGSGTSSKKKHGSGRKLKSDSDSEFELTLEEPSDLSLELTNEAPADDKKGDIFEATDFEIPALDDDSASEAVALDDGDTDLESSDFDIALDDADAAADDESASQVVALDDDDVEAARPKKKRKKVAAADLDLGDVDDLDDGPSASKALRGVRHDDEDDEEDTISPAAAAAPAPWGPLPAILMVPTLLVLFLGGLMAYELLHTVWGYQQSNKPSTPLVNWVADLAGMKPAQ